MLCLSWNAKPPPSTGCRLPLKGMWVEIEFRNTKLQRYYTQPGAAQKKFGRAVADSFFDVVDLLQAIEGLHELSQSKGFSLENLTGKRKGQRAIRLTSQWRLILKEGSTPDAVLLWEVNNHSY